MSQPSNVVRSGNVITITNTAEQWTLRTSDIVAVGALSRSEVLIVTRIPSPTGVAGSAVQITLPWAGAADRDRVRDFAVSLLTPAE